MPNPSDLSSLYSISKEQAEEYQHGGHIFLKDVASQRELDEYRPLLLGIVDEVASELDPLLYSRT